MKRFITILICLMLCASVAYKYEYLTSRLIQFFNTTPQVTLNNKNKYAKSVSYKFVQISENFVPYNFQDLLNIFYTAIDSGFDSFTFYCPSEYENCIKDVSYLSSSESVDTLTTLGNFVAPFNNFTSFKVQYDNSGEVTIYISHLYTEDEIKKINNELDNVWNKIVKADMSNEDIIYAFHDYIINNTRYDEEYDLKNPNDSSKASGPLFNGKAICSGYTDLMALVLNRLNITNYKIASDTHVWNAVYLNDKWLHLDLTWDDPVSEDHTINNLLHKFYLIDSQTLKEFDIKDHTYNKYYYQEID